MDQNKLNTALKKAGKAEGELKAACDDIVNLFQPYFDEEIEVLHQMSDGFVILYNIDFEGIHSNLNDSVIHALENIKKDKDYYRSD